MNRPKHLALSAVVPGIVCVLALAGVACGEDRMPPSYRGTPLGVEGHWHVGDGNIFNPLNVHIYNRQNPDPSESVTPIPPTITEEGPIYTILFPNWIDQEPLKLGRIQLYWASSDPTVVPVLDPLLFPGVGITGFEGTAPLPGVVVDQGPIAGGTYTGYFFDFMIRPNPDYEQIRLAFLSGTGGPTTVQLQEVDIDTVSIPEPASVSLLLCTTGLLGLSRKRR